MKTLDRLPISDRPHLVDVRGEKVDVFRNQIVAWVSIDNPARPFPALIDTGHSHNFSISEAHLDRWSGATPRRIGTLSIAGIPVVQREVNLSLHRNRPSSNGLRGDHYYLETPQGISVLPEDHPACPRLPLIGLRILIANKLRLVIDAQNGTVTLGRGWSWSN